MRALVNGTWLVSVHSYYAVSSVSVKAYCTGAIVSVIMYCTVAARAGVSIARCNP